MRGAEAGSGLVVRAELTRVRKVNRKGESSPMQRKVRRYFQWLLVAFAGVSCGGTSRRFPVRTPIVRDTDLNPVSVDCAVRSTKDDPQHLSCAPETYVSPLAWDGMDNSVFRPLSDAFALEPTRHAVNANEFDEVADSAWFTNRLGRTHPSLDTLLQGACERDELLNGLAAKAGSWRIDQGKPNGASPGFRIRVGKRKFMLKTDSLQQPERPSAASAIGAAIYHAVGFNTSCEQIVYFDPSVLKLDPGLTATDNSGISRPFDQKALSKVLEQAARRGPLVRMQASAWLPGHLIGPFRYEGTRDDDPNDVIPHENRRELRGARVLAAWLNHFDAREQNSMDSWIAVNPGVADSSPGYVRHYYLDTSDCFGSEWDWDGISRRLGNSYLLDFGDIVTDFVTLGARTGPWETARKTPGYGLFGYFHSSNFEPDGWKNEYPNPAFSRATEHDNAWMARILSRFDRADIDALVTLGEFSKPQYTRFLSEVLEQRLRRILERYLTRLSPLTDVRVQAGNRICMVDLARRRAVRPERAFRYRATLHGESGQSSLHVESGSGAEICMQLPEALPPASGTLDARARYAIVEVSNAVAEYPLLAHLASLGTSPEYRLVGIERPDTARVDYEPYGLPTR